MGEDKPFFFGGKYMPNCPKCGAEIDCVGYAEEGLIIYERGEWLKEDNPSIETFCPECGEKICLDLLE